MSVLNDLINVIICPIPCLGLIKIVSIVNLWVKNCHMNQRALSFKQNSTRNSMVLGWEMKCNPQNRVSVSRLYSELYLQLYCTYT